jgi:hypothetical protein
MPFSSAFMQFLVLFMYKYTVNIHCRFFKSNTKTPDTIGGVKKRLKSMQKAGENGYFFDQFWQFLRKKLLNKHQKKAVFGCF